MLAAWCEDRPERRREICWGAGDKRGKRVPVLLIRLDLRVIEFTIEETFSIEDSVFGGEVENVRYGTMDTA